MTRFLELPIGKEAVVAAGNFANFRGAIQDIRHNGNEIVVELEIDVFGRPTPVTLSTDSVKFGEQSLTQYLTENECVVPQTAPALPLHEPIPCPHTNFNDAFIDGAVFVTTMREVQEEFEIEVKQAGDLVVPSGKIIAAEPVQLNWKENQRPFSRSVDPGTYPVFISLANSSPACLLIKFTDQTAVSWELATKNGQDPMQLGNGQFFGYGVDAGTGGFADAGAVSRLAADNDAFEKVLQTIKEASLQLCEASDAFQCVLDESSGANVIGCTAGYGDGSYPTYWGIDEHGEVACLVTDFHILIEGRTEEILFESAAPLVGKEIEHELLATTSFRKVRLVQPEGGVPGFDLQYEGSPSMEACLIDANGNTIADTRRESLSVVGNTNYAQLRWEDSANVADARFVLTFPGQSLPLQRKAD